MKKFIAVARKYREYYKERLPFIWKMCKPVMREDIKRIVSKLKTV
jgi:hypothetical protein